MYRLTMGSIHDVLNDLLLSTDPIENSRILDFQIQPTGQLEYYTGGARVLFLKCDDKQD